MRALTDSMGFQFRRTRTVSFLLFRTWLACFYAVYMGGSINRGPQNKPQCTVIFIIGTTKMGPLVSGNSHIGLFVGRGRLWQQALKDARLHQPGRLCV